jgi:hypothetical protein
VKFQDRVTQTQSFVVHCYDALSMAYGTMFPRNRQPSELSELLDIFKSAEVVRGLVRKQMVAGAKLALIWVKICNSKIDFDEIVNRVLLKCSKRRINIDRYIEAVQGPAE